MEIVDASVLPKQIAKINDTDATICDVMVQEHKKPIFFVHRNLIREKCSLTENVPEIYHSTSELTCSSDQLNSENSSHEKSHNSDMEVCESIAENLHNNNNISDADDKSAKEIISLQTCNHSSSNDAPTINACNSVTNSVLETFDSHDEHFSTDYDVNVLMNGLTSLHLSKELLNSQNVLIPVNYSDMIRNTKSLNQLDNNNKSTFENASHEELSASSECIYNEMPIGQNMECTSSRYTDCTNTNTFKLPSFEKTSKAVNINQQADMEENAVALLDSSFTKQDLLEEVRCLDFEPRSSNSSEESTSDIESQNATANHNDIKVSYIFCFEKFIIIKN